MFNLLSYCSPRRKLSLTLLVSLSFAVSASAAIVAVEDFAMDAAGWTGSGNMAVEWSDSVGAGSPPGSLQGTFDDQGFFYIPQQGSFRIDSGEFTGAYDNIITGFTFDFMALSVMPTDLSLNLYSGPDAFYIPIVLSGMDVGVWKQFTVSLADVNWAGNPVVLESVTAIELTITRGSSAAQMFYMDNFQTIDTDFGGGDETVIPEPATLLMFGCSWFALYMMRTRVRQQVSARRNAG